MSEDDEARRGFRYHVEDEQLFAFAACSVARRLEWLEEMREFTIAASTPEIRAMWRRMRGGEAHEAATTEPEAEEA